MEGIKPVDYRKFRLRLINTAPYSHVKLLLFWPVFGLLFAFVERVGLGRGYTPVYMPLDDLIPFCEWFVIPYLFWFIYLAGMLAYTFFTDVPSFRRMMEFVILTYTITMAIYFLFPTCQNLRPTTFERDNVLTRFMAWFYTFDTNTNVCPSIHVLGAVAATVGGWNCRPFSSKPGRIAMVAVTVLICLSTVFLKQHSVVDVFAALPLCLLGIFWRPGRKNLEKAVVAPGKNVYNRHRH